MPIPTQSGLTSRGQNPAQPQFPRCRPSRASPAREGFTCGETEARSSFSLPQPFQAPSSLPRVLLGFGRQAKPGSAPCPILVLTGPSSEPAKPPSGFLERWVVSLVSRGSLRPSPSARSPCLTPQALLGSEHRMNQSKKGVSQARTGLSARGKASGPNGGAAGRPMTGPKTPLLLHPSRCFNFAHCFVHRHLSKIHCAVDFPIGKTLG